MTPFGRRNTFAKLMVWWVCFFFSHLLETPIFIWMFSFLYSLLFVFNPRSLNLWPRNAKLLYGCTDWMPFEITFVHWSPLKWFICCFFHRFLHAECGMKKNDGIGRPWMKNSSSLRPPFSSSSVCVLYCLSTSSCPLFFMHYKISLILLPAWCNVSSLLFGWTPTSQALFEADKLWRVGTLLAEGCPT